MNKLYKVSQSKNKGYDVYDSFVVACKDVDEAKYTSPDHYYIWGNGEWYFLRADGTKTIALNDSWCKPEDVVVELLGDAEQGIEGIVCSSFNAG